MYYCNFRSSSCTCESKWIRSGSCVWKWACTSFLIMSILKLPKICWFAFSGSFPTPVAVVTQRSYCPCKCHEPTLCFSLHHFLLMLLLLLVCPRFSLQANISLLLPLFEFFSVRSSSVCSFCTGIGRHGAWVCSLNALKAAPQLPGK